ncbi:MAG TPA: 1-deoxy-D-xylulose-5-phosphate synthase [Acidimicrobiales bacterium]|nr:1-deoxy-D-xylulose-5-phosphate synthase [Acidimicrobiales bacterium]
MLLDRVNSPADLKGLTLEECAELADEIRDFIVESVLRTGGHLGSNLGVVELTIALHRVFDSPRDMLLFDTGHQAYAHKVITGRKEGFAHLKQEGGLSGYPNRAESNHDFVENSHASTILSYAHGVAKSIELGTGGPALTGAPVQRVARERRVVAVVGDGALTGGMAYEALNNIGHAGAKVLIVLNDNGRSYAPTISRLSQQLTHLRLSPAYTHWRERLRKAVRDVPVVGHAAYTSIHGLTSAMREMIEPHVFFEALGVRYTGPIDGHDVPAMEQALRHAATWEGPIVLHVITTKGKGYAPAEEDEIQCLHDYRVSPVTASVTAPGASTDGGGVPAPEDAPAAEPTVVKTVSYTDAFSTAIVEAADKDERIVAITAAMPGPTGLLAFEARHPRRFIDVGIAEQHAVTAAAGMAMGGLRPVVAVYSTFFSRAFDQANMDVGLHGQPVVFCLDRAGVTGDDGASHHGLFDFVLTLSIPDMTIFSPSAACEIAPMLEAALSLDGPSTIRWPKTPSPAVEYAPVAPFASRLLREGTASVVLIGVGKLAGPTLKAAELLEAEGISATVYDPRVIRPADDEMISVAASADLVVTVEDGLAGGGAGSYLTSQIASWARAGGQRVPESLVLGMPTAYVPHGKPDKILARHGLDAPGIAASVAAAYAHCRSTRTVGIPTAEGLALDS